MKYLVTGGCGFIGHHFVEHILRNESESTIVIIDKLSYATKGYDRIRSFNAYPSNDKVKIISHDLTLPIPIGMKYEIEKDGSIDCIVHFCAETHVDNSITDPVQCIHNNVMSTVQILEYARMIKLKLFFYFSTDEVYGAALGSTLYKEWDRHNPTNPYSASKSAAENICLAYANTYKVPIMSVNVMNVIGERQHVEKFLPKVINSILKNEEILIHSYPDSITPGTRFYIHARNVASAVLFLIKNGNVGEKYNITGDREVSNLELVKLISNIIGIEAKYKMVNFHSSRPGHDLRYGLDGSKLINMGWKSPVSFEESLERTVKWTLKNLDWLTWS